MTDDKNRWVERLVSLPNGIYDRLQAISTEMVKDDFKSLQIWRDRPAMAVWYSQDPPDRSEMGANKKIQDKARSTERLIELPVEGYSPPEALFAGWLKLHREGLLVSGYIAESIEAVGDWFGWRRAVSQQNLEKRFPQEDFCLGGLSGFVDMALPRDVLLIVGADIPKSATEALSFVEVACCLIVRMDLSNAKPEPVNEEVPDDLKVWMRKDDKV